MRERERVTLSVRREKVDFNEKWEIFLIPSLCIINALCGEERPYEERRLLSSFVIVQCYPVFKKKKKKRRD